MTRNRRLRLAARACAATILAAAITAAPATAQVPPHADWRTFRTENFRVTYGPGLEDLARHAAARAELRHGQLADRVAPPPRGAIDLVITDNIDLPGGFAMVFPSNRIVLFAAPPAPESPIGYHHDWIDLVVLHELVHIFHLDRAGPLGSALRSIFGRVPAGWPFFPGYASPSWVVEGLAVHLESALTGYGRVHGTVAEMVVRTAILENAFERIDQADGYGPTWPGPHRRYIHGGLFLDYLARNGREDVARELVRRTARSWLPPQLDFNAIGARAAGRSFTTAWNEWEGELRDRYTRLADSLAATGLTRPETVTPDPYFDLQIRAAPDGRIAFSAADGRSDRGLFAFDPASGTIRRVARLNGPGAVSGVAGGGFLTAQLEYSGPYHIYSDLVRVNEDGREERVTRGLRLADPDPDPSGRRAVAVQASDGAYRLVIHDFASGSLRPITDFEPATRWTLPRWDPYGRRIAAGRWRSGGDWDVVVLDTLGAVLHEIAPRAGIAAAPAWSADGRHLLFWSDRSGIPNLYAAELDPDGGGAAGATFQVTNVLSGAFAPEPSPDGRWIHFVGYAADGFRIQRIPFDPSTWRPVVEDALAVVPAAAASEPGTGAEAAGGPARAYDPLPTLRPRYWAPLLDDRGRGGLFLGAHTTGQDLVGRHAFSLTAALAPYREAAAGPGEAARLQRTDTRFAGAFTYTYAGLGNPVLGLRMERSWDFAGIVGLPDGSTRDVLARDHELAAGATLLRRRWRSVASVTVGADIAATRFDILDAPEFRLAKSADELAGLFGRVTFSNVRAHRFSISIEDGVLLRLGARHRRDREPVTVESDQGSTTFDASYDEMNASAAAYRSLDLGGFANHVLAVRASGLLRTGPGARTHGIGGVSGALGSVALGELTGTGRFLPVRGFDSAVRAGTRGWSASVEYRAPIIIIDRGYRLLPFYLDRLSASAFLDAGNAWCTPAQARASTRCPETRLAPLLAAGAELGLDLGLFFGPPSRFRLGSGVPIQGPGSAPVFYIAAGHAF